MLTSELAERIFAISRIMKGSMSYTNNLCHLSIVQIQALDFLSRKKNAQMSEIAEYFRIELPSATALLNKLHDLGLVERIADPKDRRLVRIALTVEGSTLLKDATKERNAKVEKILSFLTEKDKEELSRLLNIIYSKIENKYEN